MIVDRGNRQIRLRREKMIKTPLPRASLLTNMIHTDRPVALFPNEPHGGIQQLLLGVALGLHVVPMWGTSPHLTDQSTENFASGNPSGIWGSYLQYRNGLHNYS